jgi:hypothetical protein
MNGKVETLTRRPGDLPEGGDERLKNMEQVDLKPHNLLKQVRKWVSDLPVQDYASISDSFHQAYQVDPPPWKILKAIREKHCLREITVAECTEQDGQVWYRGRQYVPKGD